jgi:hypothetical protein
MHVMMLNIARDAMGMLNDVEEGSVEKTQLC